MTFDSEKLRLLRIILCIFSYTLYVLGGLYTVAIMVFIMFLGTAIALGILNYLVLLLIITVSSYILIITTYYMVVKDFRVAFTVGLVVWGIATQFTATYRHEIEALLGTELTGNGSTVQTGEILNALTFIGITLLFSTLMYMGVCYIFPKKCIAYRQCKYRIHEPRLG